MILFIYFQKFLPALIQWQSPINSISFHKVLDVFNMASTLPALYLLQISSKNVYYHIQLMTSKLLDVGEQMQWINIYFLLEIWFA